MKKILSVLALSTMIISAPAFAKEVVVADVNGLVCDFCVQSIQKIFGKKPEVSKIDVNLDTKKITIELKDGQNLSDNTIKEDITNAGYNVVKISRDKKS